MVQHQILIPKLTINTMNILIKNYFKNKSLKKQIHFLRNLLMKSGFSQLFHHFMNRISLSLKQLKLFQKRNPVQHFKYF